MSDPVRGIDYGECPWCYHPWAGDSFLCPEVGDRGHRECHEECEACREMDRGDEKMEMERDMDWVRGRGA